MDSSKSCLLRAYSGERSERTPIWLMRQAGRYLPEYRELRSKFKMLDLIRNSELAAEVTLQPLNRFDLDAAIIFADILNPLIGMGIELDFVEGEGPRISNLVGSRSDVERLIVPNPEENVGYTLEAIKIVSAALGSRNIPVIGFSGAPLTLSSYLIEGRGSQSLERVKALMCGSPEVWSILQEKLSKLVSEYLIAQSNSGASALQIFDSWLGAVGPSEFEQFVLPYLKKIVSNIRAATKVPIVFFSTGTAGLYPLFKEIGADVIGVDWRISLKDAASTLGEMPLQGNLDPVFLTMAPEYLHSQVDRIMQEAKGLGSHIFNLGHGILPHTPIENVHKLIDWVREER